MKTAKDTSLQILWNSSGSQVQYLYLNHRITCHNICRGTMRDITYFQHSYCWCLHPPKYRTPLNSTGAHYLEKSFVPHWESLTSFTTTMLRVRRTSGYMLWSRETQHSTDARFGFWQNLYWYESEWCHNLEASVNFTLSSKIWSRCDAYKKCHGARSPTRFRT